MFPSVIRLDTTSHDSEFCGWKADDMLGKGMVREGVDGWLVGRLDKFRLALVEQLREGNLEIVVTQRYDLGLRTEGARDELVVRSEAFLLVFEGLVPEGMLIKITRRSMLSWPRVARRSLGAGGRRRSKLAESCRKKGLNCETNHGPGPPAQTR